MVKIDEKLLSIDRNNLEEECSILPQTMFIWGQKLAAAQREVQASKTLLKLCYAKLNGMVRTNPTESGVMKPTESAIESAILVDRGYQEKQQLLEQAEYNERILFSTVMS